MAESLKEILLLWEWMEMGIITMNNYAMERGDGEMRWREVT